MGAFLGGWQMKGGLQMLVLIPLLSGFGPCPVSDAARNSAEAAKTIALEEQFGAVEEVRRQLEEVRHLEEARHALPRGPLASSELPPAAQLVQEAGSSASTAEEAYQLQLDAHYRSLSAAREELSQQFLELEQIEVYSREARSEAAALEAKNALELFEADSVFRMRLDTVRRSTLEDAKHWRAEELERNTSDSWSRFLAGPDEKRLREEGVWP